MKSRNLALLHITVSLAAAFLLFVLTFLLLPPTAYASVNNSERETLSAMMSARGMDDMVECEELLDRHGTPTFLIGYSRDGYLIMERSTGAFMEQGGGDGPYSDNACRKYYGGFCCYVQDDGKGLVNAVTGKKVSSIPYISAAEEMISDLKTANISGGNREDGLSSSSSSALTDSVASIVSTKQLSNAHDKVKGVAFGRNVDEDIDAEGRGNTCSAVALSIALNYLDYAYDGGLVPEVYELEARTTSSYDSLKYPKATAFHQHLVDDCGLDPWYVIDEFTPGVWGGKLKAGYYNYLTTDGQQSVADTDFDWRLVNQGAICDGVDSEKPSLVTVGYTEWDDGTGGGDNYSFHTMVVYGYRVFDNGLCEVALHSGWYSSPTTRNNGKYYMNEIWMPANIAILSYHFSLSDGWHCSGAGDWRYYENGSFATGWKTIGGNTYYFSATGVRTTGQITLGGVRYFFDGNGVLVSQSSVGSPSTGGSVYELLASGADLLTVAILPGLGGRPLR